MKHNNHHTSFFFADPIQWSAAQWGHAELGDVRRTRRAVKLGAAIAEQSASSLPKQTDSWGELKAAYRLVNEEDVTYEQLSIPHRQATRKQAEAIPEVILFVQDTSELNFGSHEALEGRGHIADGSGRGFLMHTCLCILPDASNPGIIGLARQTIWARERIMKRWETLTQRQKRRNEADIWAETLEAIGSAPKGCTWVSVGDRGSDVFSYVRRARTLGWHCLLRMNANRRILTKDGSAGKLKEYIRSKPAEATKPISVHGRNGKPARTILLQVAWTALTLMPPSNRAEKREHPQPGWVVRCWNEAEGLEWILFSTLPVLTTKDALLGISWYEHRWIIEEYHKCLKTGCAIEKRQLATTDGLRALFAFLTITAVRLLQLRSLARTNPHNPAMASGIDPLLLTITASRLNRELNSLTLAEFWRGVAMVGGFIGRKSDGEPGWQTLWDGWRRLQDMAWGAEWEKAEFQRCG